MGARHEITTVDALEAIYGAPRPQSLLKEVEKLTPEYKAWIDASPFVVLASVGAGGLDCTPRGDAAGIVEVVDERTLLLPDRVGNNRIDTLRNLVADPRVALLFLIPGREESIRVIGRAVISADPGLVDRCSVDGKRPRTVLVISIERVFFQCARALKRSRLWMLAQDGHAPALPSIGQILQSISKGVFDGAAYDDELQERLNKSLY